MNFKKVMVGALACSMVAAMSVATFADGTEGQAVLSLNNDAWAAAASTPVDITGAGQYTITGTFEEPSALAQFSALEIVGGESVFGHDVEIIIDSIVFDGEEVKIADSYTCSKDGKGVDTRVNIYNEWNNPDDLNVVDDKAGYADNRAAGKTEDQVSAKLISDDYIQYDGHDATKKVTEAKITFTVKTADSDVAGDVAPVAYLAAIVAVAGIAMVASKKRA